MKNLNENEFEKFNMMVRYIASLFSEHNIDDTQSQSKNVSENVDPHAKLKQALKDGKSITITVPVTNQTVFKWNSDGWKGGFDWSLPPECYTIVENDPVDPYAELKQAVKDGKQIELKVLVDDDNSWFPVSITKNSEWLSLFPADQYRIVENDPVDPYAELKQAVKDGKQIQVKYFNNDRWYNATDATQLRWNLTPDCYRIVEDEPVDPYAELKQAVKDGKQIQINDNDNWYTTPHPNRLSWILTPDRYRILKELDWDMIPAGTLFDLELHNGDIIKGAAFYKNTGDIQFSTIGWTCEWSDIKSVKIATQEFKSWLGVDHGDLWDIPGVLVQVVFRGDTEIDYDANSSSYSVYTVNQLNWHWYGRSYDIIAYRIAGLQDGYTEKYC